MRNWPDDYRQSDSWAENVPPQMTASGRSFMLQHLRDLQYFTRDLQLLETLDDAATVVDAALSNEKTTRTPLRTRLEAMGVWSASLDQAPRD